MFWHFSESDSFWDLSPVHSSLPYSCLEDPMDRCVKCMKAFCCLKPPRYWEWWSLYIAGVKRGARSSEILRWNKRCTVMGWLYKLFCKVCGCFVWYPVLPVSVSIAPTWRRGELWLSLHWWQAVLQSSLQRDYLDSHNHLQGLYKGGWESVFRQSGCSYNTNENIWLWTGGMIPQSR